MQLIPRYKSIVGVAIEGQIRDRGIIHGAARLELLVITGMGTRQERPVAGCVAALITIPMRT
ncbi:hypothetical protein [Streptomyces mirabilis]|uniref:hypothetical protein n=1 Tax=Streptomyces mirabilis TaxID=68239 RepID=UPI00332EFAFD